ncbi:MAG TPA: amidase [Vicinamibacterales bacterium]|nr:amidase [Vicinamibacterales bacterium]
MSKLSIAVLAARLRSRELRAVDLVDACLREIDRRRDLNAFIAVFADAARADAEAADRELAAGRARGPLHGIPVSLKDLIDVAGVPTTAASRVREGHRAAADAPLVTRLRHAGAILIGKTNLHEFAFGTTTEDSAFGPARNPFDPSCSPGGSSGGSGIAVATGMSVASVGTDTGGSIRIPAAACGIVGLKPTLGEIPTAGIVPLSQTFDHAGPMTRGVLDAALMYDVLAGRAASVDEWSPAAAPLHFVVPEPYYLDRLDPDVRARFVDVCQRLRDGGHNVTAGAVEHAALVPSVYLHIVMAEAAAYHAATLESMPERYVPSVRTRLEMGRYVLGEDYVRAMRGREALTAAVDAALGNADALLLPSLAVAPPRLGAASVEIDGAKEPVRAITLRLTQTFNITGHPAVSLPMGLTREALPCGCQIVARRGATRQLLRIALACEDQIGCGPGSVGGGTG